MAMVIKLYGGSKGIVYVKTTHGDELAIPQDADLMQSTSLHDKHEVEIYESDLLKFTTISEDYSRDRLYRVDFIKGSFVDNYYHWTLPAGKFIEVISNVYEHKALLTEKGRSDEARDGV